MGFFVPYKMRLVTWISIGLLGVGCVACQDSEPSAYTLNDEGELIPVFGDFEGFPNQQYLTFSLGDSNAEMVRKIGYLKVEPVAVTEVYHFYFPSDSTEVIIPDQPVITEFKVFLKSQYYLQNESHFYDFFETLAKNTVNDPDFSLFEFSSEEQAFKMSYFKQPEFIRLHFVLHDNHS